MNRLLTGRVEFLTSLEQNIAAVIGADNSAVIKDIDRQLNEMQTELLKCTSARVGYDDVAIEIDRLRAEKQKLQLEAADHEDRKKRMDDMRIFLREHSAGIIELDEKLVRRLVEKISVLGLRLSSNQG